MEEVNHNKNKSEDEGPIFSHNNSLTIFPINNEQNARSQGSQRSCQIESNANNNDDDDSQYPSQTILPSAKHVEIFWQRFSRLEEQSPDNTVNGTELKADLVSSNRLFVGDATQIVEFIVKTGQIEQIAYDVYRRR
jgi:hypothetical protein